MTSIVPVGPALPFSGREPRKIDPEAAPETGTAVMALVPVVAAPPPAEDERRSFRRNSASFIAQLIANEKQLPQTRERRRAEPQVALAAYGAAARLVKQR